MGGGGEKVPGQYVKFSIAPSRLHRLLRSTTYKSSTAFCITQPSYLSYFTDNLCLTRYMGWWGSLGSPTQKGIITYSLSANRQNPLAGTLHAAIFNTFRRTRQQIFFWGPPMLIAYSAMNWAAER